MKGEKRWLHFSVYSVQHSVQNSVGAGPIATTDTLCYLKNNNNLKKGEKKMITAGCAFLGALAAWAGMLVYDSLN